MDITYLGHSSFKIKTKTGTVITDPFDPEMVGLKYAGAEGEVVTVSHQHKDHSSYDKVTGVKKVIEGPGEYEILGITILGYQTFHDDNKGADRGKNTVYAFEVEGLRVVHLGDLGHILSEDMINEIGDVDVLMVPVGGEYTIGPKEAATLVSKISPFYVLPMHYKKEGMKAELAEKLLPVEDFLKESGLTTENLPKFSIKKEDIIEDQNTKVIVLEKK